MPNHPCTHPYPGDELQPLHRFTGHAIVDDRRDKEPVDLHEHQRDERVPVLGVTSERLAWAEHAYHGAKHDDPAGTVPGEEDDHPAAHVEHGQDANVAERQVDELVVHVRRGRKHSPNMFKQV